MKTDCFAYHVGPRGGARDCKALKILDCTNCSFYKTNEERSRADERTRKRLEKIKWVNGEGRKVQ